MIGNRVGSEIKGAFLVRTAPQKTPTQLQPPLLFRVRCDTTCLQNRFRKTPANRKARFLETTERRRYKKKTITSEVGCYKRIEAVESGRNIATCKTAKLKTILLKTKKYSLLLKWIPHLISSTFAQLNN